MRAWLKRSKARLIALGTLAVAGLLLALPWAWWMLTPSRSLDVVVVDKTVPTTDYRKHAGVLWVLRYEKIVQRATGRPFEDSRDYVGYHHHEDGTATGDPMPDRESDLTYVADTYGVYDTDTGARPGGLRAKLIYGGLTVDEVRTLAGGVRPGGTLAAEFSTLGDPTGVAARLALGEALGVRPTGWAGRWFAYLDLTVDLPLWIPRTWQRQTGRRWDFRGPGYVFVNAAGNGQIVVLQEGVDTPPKAIELVLSAPEADRTGGERRTVFDNWTEIVEPLDGTEVLAEFELRLTDRGRRAARGLPAGARWPAIMRSTRGGRVNYYLAGEFADRPDVGIYRYRGIPWLKRLGGQRERGDGLNVYWGVFVPFMRRMIDDAVAAAG